MNRQVQIVGLAVAALVLSGGGFVAGMTVGPTLVRSDATAASPSPGAGGAQARRAGAGAGGAFTIPGGAQGQQVSGRVISVNDASITVELRQPGGEPARSVIALVGGTARVVRTTEVDIKLADIKPGDQVLIVGQPDQATGTVSANAVVVGIGALQQLFGGDRSGGGAPGAGAQFRPSGSPGVRPGPAASASPRP